MRPASAWIAFAFALTLVPDASGEFVPLFNGADLDGWTQRAGDPARRGSFHVEDGAIVGTYVAGTANTFLATERTFGDFVLTFEFKMPAEVNSGVQFRSSLEGRGVVAGYQFELDPLPRAWTGGVYHEGGRGWLYPLELNPAAKPLLRLDVWNTGRVECRGRSIRTWLNGEPVAHLIDDALERGFVALQLHGLPRDSPLAGRTIRWRNIEIDVTPGPPTPPDPALFIRNIIPNDLDPAEVAVGWQPLFDGADASAWRGALAEGFPTRGWRIENGSLIVEGSGGGDIITRAVFDAFELQVEFWPSRRANSGIKYMVREDAATNQVYGLEYQILDDKTHEDAVSGFKNNRTLASLYDMIPSDRRVNGREVPRRVNAWNHARIVCRPDGRVEHWLNDFRVVDYTRGDGAYRVLVSRSKYKDIDRFGLGEAGHLLLQDHGDEVHFRSIKVRRLE